VICIGSIHWHPTPDDPFGDLEIAGLHEGPPADTDLTAEEADEAAAAEFLESVRAVAPELLN
jgi:hypothetical protein